MEGKRGMNRSLWLLTIAATILLILVSLYYPYSRRAESGIFLPTDCSNNSDCFIEQANACKPATTILDIGNLGLRYESMEGCRFRKTITRVGTEEPEEMRLLLENRSVECDYETGKFDSRLVFNLTLGLENCSGQLRYRLQTIQDAYHARLERARQSKEVFEEPIVNASEIS